MTLRGLVDCDIVNYKLPSLFLAFPNCSFKCGKDICQNYSLRYSDTVSVSTGRVVEYFDACPVTKAVVCGGLEPFDSEDELKEFTACFREKHCEPIVIYTGYTEDEVKEKFGWIFSVHNLVIKYGRYIQNQKPHYDEVLGVYLASDNQYAKEYNFK